MSPWEGGCRGSGPTLAASCNFSFCLKLHLALPAAQGLWGQSCGGSGVLLLPWGSGGGHCSGTSDTSACSTLGAPHSELQGSLSQGRLRVGCAQLSVVLSTLEGSVSCTQQLWGPRGDMDFSGSAVLWPGKQNLFRISALLVWSQLGLKPDLEGAFPDAPISFLAVGATCSSCSGLSCGMGVPGLWGVPGAAWGSAAPTHLLLQALWGGTGPVGSPGLDHLMVVWAHLTELGFPLRAGSLVVFILPRIFLEVFFTRCSKVQPGSVKP